MEATLFKNDEPKMTTTALMDRKAVGAKITGHGRYQRPVPKHEQPLEEVAMSRRDSICAHEEKPLTALDYALQLLRDGTLSIDDCGRVWRHAEMDGWGNRKTVEPRRAESPTKKGYLRVNLKLPAPLKMQGVQAHRLVWTWLKGPIPDGLQINHKDLNKQNNHPGNLEPIDNAGNIQHSYDNGRTMPWSKATEWRPGIEKRTEADYSRWRQLRAAGMSQREICEREGVSRTHLQRILYRKAGV